MDEIQHWLGLNRGALTQAVPRLSLVVVLFVGFSLLETFFPAQPGQGLRGRLRNLALAALFVLLGTAAITTVKLAFFPLPLQRRVDGGMAISLLWCFGYLAVGDFIYYWYHRAQHRFRTLWALHELHHSDAELNVITSYRTYWLESPIQFLLLTIPSVVILGVDARALAMLAFASTVLLLFTHTNLRLRLGFLTPVICGPHLHRIHHSTQPSHQGKNFAQFLPVYDVLFGTYYRPRWNEFPETGTPEVRSDEPLWRFMIRPVEIWYGLAVGAFAAQRTSTDSSAKIGRNDPCPCNSGRKFKVCHGRA